MSLARFIDKWTHEDYPPTPVSIADLDATEARFGLMFAEDYRQALVAHGLPRPAAALLHSIVEAELDLPDVSDFFEPADIVKLTDDWRGGGMPSGLVAFANDCAGNLFCFKPGDNQGLRPDRATVWLWNHDTGEVTAAADSFTLWIEQFCSVDFIQDDFHP